MLQAAVLNYTLAETQWEIDWTTLLSLANQPGSSLEQIHIFALSHIMRRVSVAICNEKMQPELINQTSLWEFPYSQSLCTV